MSFSLDIPEECFGPNAAYDEKYCLVRCSQHGWFVVSRKRHYHSQVMEEWTREHRLKAKAADCAIEVHGGGILVVEGGHARTFGSSGGYGPVKDLDTVRACLEHDKRLVLDTIEATDYIRD